MKNESREAVEKALAWYGGAGWESTDRSYQEGSVLAAEVRRLEALAVGLARALGSAKESLGHCQGETDKQKVWGLAMEAELGITFALQTPEVRALLSKAAKSQEGA